MKLSITVVNEVQFTTVLKMLEGAVKDATPAWKLIVEDFKEYEKETFASEGAISTRHGWQPLSRAYESWKAVQYPNKKILHASGALENSLTGGPGFYQDIRPLALAVGSTLRDKKTGKWNIGLLHQMGTFALPVREVIRLSDAKKKDWRKIVAKTFRQSVDKARLPNR